MKQFTVKDFLSYNNPCFSCKSAVNFYFGTVSKNISEYSPTSYITPIVSNTSIEVDLKKTYLHSLTLNITHKTNKLKIVNIHEFKSFLSDHKIYLVLHCPTCQTSISSEYLLFDLKNHFINPTTVRSEIINVKDHNNYYNVVSYMYNYPCSRITVRHKDGSDPFSITTSPLLLYKFKNQDQLIKKIKTYLLFS